MLDGRAQPTGIRSPARTRRCCSSSTPSRRRRLHPARSHRRRPLGTAHRHQPAEPGRESPFAFGHTYEVTGRSLLLFVLQSVAPSATMQQMERTLSDVAEKATPIPPPVDAGHGRVGFGGLARRRCSGRVGRAPAGGVSSPRDDSGTAETLHHPGAAAVCCRPAGHVARPGEPLTPGNRRHDTARSPRRPCRFDRRHGAAGRGRHLPLEQRQRHSDLGHPFAEQRPAERHPRHGLRVAVLLQRASFEIEPVLATGFRQITPTQVRITLRSGVKFHDGATFNADDVVFSLDPGDGQDLELRCLHARHRQGGEGRRPDGRHPHQGAEPGAAAPAHRAAHDGQGLGREAQGRPARRTSRRKDESYRPPQCQRHRPLHAEELGPGREAGSGAQPELLAARSKAT